MDLGQAVRHAWQTVWGGDWPPLRTSDRGALFPGALRADRRWDGHQGVEAAGASGLRVGARSSRRSDPPRVAHDGDLSQGHGDHVSPRSRRALDLGRRPRSAYAAPLQRRHPAATLPGLAAGALAGLATTGDTPIFIGVAVGAAVFIEVPTAPLLLLGGLWEVFISSLWTLTYRELRRFPRSEPVTAPSVEMPNLGPVVT